MHSNGRDQVFAAIHQIVTRDDIETFVQSDWGDNITTEIMRKLVELGALPAEYSPDRKAT